jgi:hypothetical protein
MRTRTRLLSALSLLLCNPALAQGVAFGPNDVRSLFHVAKSENQNQVHYAIRLDAACQPSGKRPVFAYWRRLRGEQRVDGPLEGLGTRFYGASDEQTVKSWQTGGQVYMHVKALPAVRIRVEVSKSSNGCRATAFTNIANEPSQLSFAYLQLAKLKILGVKYVDVVGFRLRDGARVAQRHD